MQNVDSVDQVQTAPSVQSDPDLQCPQQPLVSSTELTHSHTMTPFDAPGKQAF